MGSSRATDEVLDEEELLLLLDDEDDDEEEDEDEELLEDKRIELELDLALDDELADELLDVELLLELLEAEFGLAESVVEAPFSRPEELLVGPAVGKAPTPGVKKEVMVTMTWRLS